MNNQCFKRAAARCGMAVLLAVCGATSVGAAADRLNPLPPFGQVEKAVRQHFTKLPNYKPGDIISRSDAEPVFAILGQMGWIVPGKKEILAAIPGDRDFLVQALRTKQGRKFMADIAKYPEAYDRLDRLARLPHGKATVRALIRGPDGYKMIRYMTTKHGGIEMGKMLSNAPKGGNFNKPTGRLYTVDLLLTRLRQSHTPVRKIDSPAPGQRSAR